MIDKLKSEKDKKHFYIIIILLLSLIFVLRYFVIPYYFSEEIKLDRLLLYQILDKIFISILVTIGLGTFVFWITPKNKLNAQIRIVQPMEIGESIVKSRDNTDKWMFNGQSGRFTRNQTLPAMADLSKRKNKSIDVTLLMLNPSNDELVDMYVEYKNGIRSVNRRGKKTRKSVRIDLLSTIVSCHVWRQEQPLLNIVILLKNNYSLFRVDLSSNKVIITREDPLEPALLFEAGTFFYQAYLEELRQLTRQSIRVDFNKVNGMVIKDEQDVHAFLSILKLDDLVEVDDLGLIYDNLQSRSNPYA